MACYNPISAYRTKDKFSTTGYNVAFKETAENIIGQVKIPCGRCIGCRLEYSRQWAIRCVHEASMHEKNSFVTLTYNNENLPNNETLKKYEMTAFIKRLRKKYDRKNYGRISYYYCGEYGEKKNRPHYHICLFGFDVEDKKYFKTTELGHKLYTSEIIEELWQKKGHCLIGGLTFESAAYVARYVTKKITGEKSKDHYGERIPEFSRMSRKPAIGLTWIEKYHTDVYPSDELILRGKKMKPARYYDKYYSKNHKEKFENIKEDREEVMYTKSLSNENTPERLNVKHQIKMIAKKRLTRSYEMDDYFEMDKNSLPGSNTKTYDDALIYYNNKRLRKLT